MKEIKNFEKGNESVEFEGLEPGIYGCQIKSVEDVIDKEYLLIEFDIVKGDYKDYYKKQFDSFGNWSGKVYKSYKETASKFFSAFITAIEKSNANYVWNWNEQSLVGKYFMGIFGEEEYINKDNELKTIVKIQEVRSIDAFNKGELKVPTLKKLKVKPQENQQTVEINDDDLPF